MRKLLTTLLAVVALLVVADRVAPTVASAVLASRIADRASLSGEPEVAFHGFPFLTQVAAGRYDDVEVSADGVSVGRLHGLTVHSHLRGAHLPLSDVISRDIGPIPVDLVTGTASISYADLVRAADLPDGIRIDSVRHSGDGLAVRATAQLAGQSVTVTAHGAVRVEQGAVVLSAADVSVPDLPAGLPGLAGLADDLGFRVPVDGLPFGLSVTGVRATDDGLTVTARARGLVLNGSASPAT